MAGFERDPDGSTPDDQARRTAIWDAVAALSGEGPAMPDGPQRAASAPPVAAPPSASELRDHSASAASPLAGRASTGVAPGARLPMGAASAPVLFRILTAPTPPLRERPTPEEAARNCRQGVREY